MQSRNQYLRVLRERYLRAKAKKEKTQILDEYCRRGKLEFTRSRPNRKNDNAYIEQKNWTHVRKVLGYLRYDTPEELMIISQLFQGELRSYKNFFQPVMKLTEKIRIGGSVKRKYDIPKTPYYRLTESNQISDKAKAELETLYLSLNPAQLKRDIESKLDKLYQTYERKRRTHEICPHRKLVPHMTTFLMMQQPKLGYLLK